MIFVELLWLKKVLIYGFATSRKQIVEYLEILFHKKANYAYQYCKGNIFY